MDERGASRDFQQDRMDWMTADEWKRERALEPEPYGPPAWLAIFFLLTMAALVFLAGYFLGAYVTHRSLTTARAVTGGTEVVNPQCLAGWVAHVTDHGQIVCVEPTSGGGTVTYSGPPDCTAPDSYRFSMCREGRPVPPPATFPAKARP